MGCGTDASDGSGVAVGYKANGVGGVGGVSVISDAVGVGGGDTTHIPQMWLGFFYQL